MTETCGAAHPAYKNIYCCRIGPCAELLHTAPIRRGQWVTWLVVGNTPRRRRVTRDTMPIIGPAPPRILLLENQDYGRVGIKSHGKCWYCGIGFTHVKRTLDHVVPRSKGGSNDPENLVFACQPCNTDKANMSVEAYRRRVQALRGVERVTFYGEIIQRCVGVE